MQISEFAFSAATAFLSGFLFVSGWLADVVSSGLAYIAPSESTVLLDEHAGEEFRIAPSEYEDERSISRILLEDPNYQQAAAHASLEQAPPKLPAVPVPEQIESALVNIFCTFTAGGGQRVATGSGVVIDPRGVILTNAHVAQFLLLEALGNDRDATCVIRQGNPAESRYEAELLYVSPHWINRHANLIDVERPTGTGARDYALLYIARGIDTVMPEQFPSISPNVSFLTKKTIGSAVYVAGFLADGPAESAEEALRTPFRPLVSETTVFELYTFQTGHADLMSVSPTTVGENGASGGPVVTKDGSLVGLISTKGNPEREGEGSLRALTLSYVDRAVTEETGFGLAATIAGDLPFRSQIFKEALVPFLAQRLNAELSN